MQRIYCSRKTGERIGAADIGSAFFMDGLQTKLNPDKFFRIGGAKLVKKCEHIIWKAVRPGCDGDSCNVSILECLCVKAAQPADRGVGIGICLKIDDEPLPGFFRTKKRKPILNLFCDGKRSGIDSKITAAASTAENTAVISKRAVTVWAGHACIYGDFIKFFMKYLLAVSVKRVIRLI